MSCRLNSIIFTASVILAVGIRSIMLLFTIEPKTGFVRPEQSAFAAILSAILIVGAVAVFVLGLLTKPQKTRTAYGGGIFFPVTGFLLSIAMLYETFLSELLVSVHPMQKILQFIFALLAAGALCFISVGKFKGEFCNPFIAIVPIFFWLMRLVIIFSGFSTISTISDTVIETAGLCLALITFLFFAKVESGHMKREKYNIAFAISLLNAYIYFVASVPRILCELVAFKQAIHLNTIPVLTGLATALFCTFFAYRMFRVGKAEE